MAMVSLREHMEAQLAGWKDDLSAEWRAVFDGVGPDFNAIPAGRQIDDATSFFPRRRGQQLEGAPPGSHLCRAFDNIAPGDVQVVVLGQDPYPDRSRATGRAFEQGNWAGGAPGTTAPSLAVLLQSVILTDPSADAAIPRGQRDWPSVRRTINLSRDVQRYFDGLAVQGVLFVNAAWTFTSRRGTHCHLNLWRPVVDHFLLDLCGRDPQPIFLLLGAPAQDRFDGARVQATCVRHDHPTIRGGNFFADPNPFLRVNNALVGTGREPITWWPPMENEVRA